LWEAILEKFRDKPGQMKVATFLLRYGFSVDRNGTIRCVNVEIPHSKVSKALEVDRRVVVETAKTISSDPELLKVYSKIEPAGMSLRNIAKEMGMGLIIITADPTQVGIVAGATSIISKLGISIRQIIADDPELHPEPKLTIITDKHLPGEVIDEILRIKGVRDVSIIS